MINSNIERANRLVEIVEEETDELYFEYISDRDTYSESLVSLESRESNEEELRQFCSKFNSASNESSNSVDISQNKEKMQKLESLIHREIEIGVQKTSSEMFKDRCISPLTSIDLRDESELKSGQSTAADSSDQITCHRRSIKNYLRC